MSVISKSMFDEKVKPHLTCRKLLHPESESCKRAQLKFSYTVWKSLFVLYSPAYLQKLFLLKSGWTWKNVFKAVIKPWLRSQVFGMCYCATILAYVCLASNVKAQYSYYDFVIGLSFLPGLAIFVEHYSRRNFVSVLYASFLVEAIINNISHFKIFAFTPIKETILFMISNAFLMHFFAKAQALQKSSVVWFYIPNSKSFQIKECFNYFLIGFALNASRRLVARVKNLITAPKKVLISSFFTKSNFKFGLFFGTYSFLFKMALRVLEKYNLSTTNKYAFAGAISGASYLFQPTRSILGLVIANLCQIIFVKMTQQKKWVKHFPVTELTFCLSNMLLFCNRICLQKTCPKSFSNILTVGSSGELDKVYNRLVALLV